MKGMGATLRGLIRDLSESDQACTRRAVSILNDLLQRVDRESVADLLKELVRWYESTLHKPRRFEFDGNNRLDAIPPALRELREKVLGNKQEDCNVK